MSRRKSRVLAFQALYSHDVGGVSVDDLAEFSWAGKMDGGESAMSSRFVQERTFARLLFTGTVEHLEEVDEIIKAHLAAKWSMDRINKVSLEILRLATYEMLYQGDASVAVIIDEAVKIAKEYGADDSFKFINAVLDNIRKKKEH